MLLKDWNITINEYYGDKELRAAVDNVRRYSYMGKAKRSMEERIFSNLLQRAQAGCSTEEGALRSADLRNRIMLQRDYEAYKKEMGA